MDTSRWQTFDPCLLDSARRAPACYVITFNQEVVYVRQTVNLRKRMSEHRFTDETDGSGEICAVTPWGRLRGVSVWGRVKYAKRIGEQLMVEARLIHRLQPRLNRRGIR